MTETVDEFDAAFDEINSGSSAPVEDKSDDVLLEEGPRDAAGEGGTDLQASSEKPADSTETVVDGGDQAAGEEPGEGVSDQQGSEEDQEPDLAAIQRERDQLLQYRRSNEGRVSALQQKINQLERRQAPQRQAPPPANITPEKWGEFEEEYPEIAQAINARMGAMEQTISHQVSGQIGQAVRPLQNAEQTRYLQSQYAALEAAHPDWKDVVKSEPFKEWLNDQPKAVQGFMGSEDASDASYLLDTYKHSTPQQPAAQAEPDPKVAEIQAQREKKLTQAQGIKSRPTPGATGGMPDDFDSAFDHFVREKERVSR